MRWIALLLFATSIQAATISGHVVDSTGAALQGVSVQTSASSAITDSSGHFALNATTPADITFQLLGFATTIRHEVAPGSTLDVTLALAASEEVVVTGETLLGVADAASAGVITAEQIERQPFERPGDVMEKVPGIVISQHSGEGKANQYYLRGFNLDHGTDVAISVAGVPVNMPSHAHGQGYADVNFLIPELIRGIQYEKGPYYADKGDFASAGAVDIDYVDRLEHPLATIEAGQLGWQRVFAAASPQVGDGVLLTAIEAEHNNGPWQRGDELRKLNAVVRWSRGDATDGASVTGMFYCSRWDATDQVPARAIASGTISRFGAIDPTDGGDTHRASLAAEWQRGSSTSFTHARGYFIDYGLDLFSNFTYFLNDPVNGDQFEQVDRRRTGGFTVDHRWIDGRAENTVGVEARHDEIPTLALFHTRARRRLSATRIDDVRETSVAAYAQTSIAWTPLVRTIAGLRADHYVISRDASIASPKLTLIAGPWRETELYANAGFGFHSNDARGVAIGATPLVRTKGEEIGIRSTRAGFQATAALWALDIDSELVFAGDNGTTEANRASRRRGVELSATWNAARFLALDGDVAVSHARFRDGAYIPGSPRAIASVGAAIEDAGRWSADVRFRYFGPRPLVETRTVRSPSSRLVTTRVGYEPLPRVRLHIDVFNVLNARVSDVDYFYASRLPGEPPQGVDDVHTHPTEPRSLRVGISTNF